MIFQLTEVKNMFYWSSHNKKTNITVTQAYLAEKTILAH